MAEPRRALVTGGSGDIGAAVCRALAATGVHVVVHANSRIERASSLVAELTAQGGRASAKAVSADPDQGYIIDSLAWAYFRLGRYDEALQPMEKASVLEPVDPIVTDHLGDVYWMVGRKLEAQFQWHRALSFKPTETDAARILRKLEVGLDTVMADEAAAPPIEAAESSD